MRPASPWPGLPPSLPPPCSRAARAPPLARRPPPRLRAHFASFSLVPIRLFSFVAQSGLPRQSTMTTTTLRRRRPGRPSSTRARRPWFTAGPRVQARPGEKAAHSPGWASASATLLGRGAVSCRGPLLNATLFLAALLSSPFILFWARVHASHVETRIPRPLSGAQYST